MTTQAYKCNHLRGRRILETERTKRQKRERERERERVIDNFCHLFCGWVFSTFFAQGVASSWTVKTCTDPGRISQKLRLHHSRTEHNANCQKQQQFRPLQKALILSHQVSSRNSYLFSIVTWGADLWHCSNIQWRGQSSVHYGTSSGNCQGE